MEHTSAQKLARVLRVMVILVFVCNIAALFAVPGMVVLSPRSVIDAGIQEASYLLGLEQMAEHEIYFPLAILLADSWAEVWKEAYSAVLTVFLWACGICTAVILWQAKRVLDTILAGATFTFGNAANMKRAAVCCFVISGAALLRTIWGLFYYRSAGPLLTYNALFVPIFLMAGLLCMVMSALFRQAAELKEENDLTI